jgi:hypothetical protein
MQHLTVSSGQANEDTQVSVGLVRLVKQCAGRQCCNTSNSVVSAVLATFTLYAWLCIPKYYGVPTCSGTNCWPLREHLLTFEEHRTRQQCL